MIGTQFHPEADAVGMSLLPANGGKRKRSLRNHGYEKWESMIAHLNDPIRSCTPMPVYLFLQHSINRLVPVEV